MPREFDREITHAWEWIAQEITEEKDPAKLLELVKKLNDAMLAEEREKAQRRLGIPAGPKSPAA